MKKMTIIALIACMTMTAFAVSGCGNEKGAAAESASVSAEETSESAEETLSVEEAETSSEPETASETSAEYETESESGAEAAESLTLKGKYQIKDADATYYDFEDDGTCYYIQDGTYTLTTDYNSDGVEADVVAMQFDLQDTPVNYTIESSDDGVSLSTTSSGDQSETVIPLAFVEGTDGITGQDAFSGTYKAFDTDEYLYVFNDDGTFQLRLEEQYAQDGDTLTLSAFGKSFDYQLQDQDGSIELLTDDQTVATLIPVE